MKTRVLTFSLLALLCVSCTATLNRRKPYGEKVRISLLRSLVLHRDAELLAFDDSMMYYEDSNRVRCERWDRVKSVRVLAYGTYRTLRWVCWLPTLAIGVSVLANPGNPGEATEAAVAAAFTGLILYLTQPRATFHSPPTERDRERLRLFARYPQGLTGDQWQDLLHAHGQTGFLTSP